MSDLGVPVKCIIPQNLYGYGSRLTGPTHLCTRPVVGDRVEVVGYEEFRPEKVFRRSWFVIREICHARMEISGAPTLVVRLGPPE